MIGGNLSTNAGGINVLKYRHQIRTADAITTENLDDFETGTKIAHNHDWIHNYCGKTTLAQLLAILTKAQMLVGNDSGSMHMMAALQRPQIAIFGSTSTTWTGPINDNASVMSRNLSCSPCFSRTCRFGHYDCLTKINPENVFAEVKKHLSKVY